MHAALVGAASGAGAVSKPVPRVEREGHPYPGEGGLGVLKPLILCGRCAADVGFLCVFVRSVSRVLSLLRAVRR